MERSRVIDAMKGIAILLVVLGHTWALAPFEEFNRVILTFDLPVFLFVAGVFLRPGGSTFGFALSKADAILKPYAVALLALGLWWGSLNATYVGDVLYGIGPSVVWPWVPVWFLPHLFVTLVLCFLLLRLVRAPSRIWYLPLAVVLIGLGVALSRTLRARGIVTDEIGLPGCADIALISAGFVLAGYACRDQVLGYRPRLSHLALALVVFGGLHVFSDASVNFRERVYDSFPINTAEAFSGIALVLIASCWIVAWAPLGALFVGLGQRSIFILIFHAYVHDKLFLGLEPFVAAVAPRAVISVGLAILAPVILYEIVRRTPVLGAAMLPMRRAARGRPADAPPVAPRAGLAAVMADGQGGRLP